MSAAVKAEGGREPALGAVKPMLRQVGAQAARLSWRVASWLLCALVSVNLVLLVALRVGPTALSLMSQSFSGIGATGAAAIAVLSTVILGVVVVTGFACWACVIVLRGLWRWRTRLLNRNAGLPAEAEVAAPLAKATKADRRRSPRCHG